MYPFSTEPVLSNNKILEAQRIVNNCTSSKECFPVKLAQTKPEDTLVNQFIKPRKNTLENLIADKNVVCTYKTATEDYPEGKYWELLWILLL